MITSELLFNLLSPAQWSLHWASFRVQGYRAYSGKAWETQGSTWNRKPSNTKRPLASWSHWGDMRTATVFIKINEQIKSYHIKPTQKSKYRQHLWSTRLARSHDEFFPVYKQGLGAPQEFSRLLVQLSSLGNPYFGSELSLSKYLPWCSKSQWVLNFTTSYKSTAELSTTKIGATPSLNTITGDSVMLNLLHNDARVLFYFYFSYTFLVANQNMLTYINISCV